MRFALAPSSFSLVFGISLLAACDGHVAPGIGCPTAPALALDLSTISTFPAASGTIAFSTSQKHATFQGTVTLTGSDGSVVSGLPLSNDAVITTGSGVVVVSTYYATYANLHPNVTYAITATSIELSGPATSCVYPAENAGSITTGA